MRNDLEPDDCCEFCGEELDEFGFCRNCDIDEDDGEMPEHDADWDDYVQDQD